MICSVKDEKNMVSLVELNNLVNSQKEEIALLLNSQKEEIALLLNSQKEEIALLLKKNDEIKTLVKNLIGHIELQEIKLKNRCPIGSIKLFGGLEAPEGWLLCDGSVVLRENFKELFDVIGETYGQGDDDNSFRLPDLRGRTAIGAGKGNDLTDHELGEKIGSEAHNLTIKELPNHKHSGTTSSNGDHNHSGKTSSNGGHNHSGTTGGANRMRIKIMGSVGLNGGIDGIHGPGHGNDNTGPSIDKFDTLDFAYSSHTHNLTTDNKGSHNHTFDTDNNGKHQHSIPSEGNGQPYSVMQPSLSLNYIIKY